VFRHVWKNPRGGKKKPEKVEGGTGVDAQKRQGERNQKETTKAGGSIKKKKKKQNLKTVRSEEKRTTKTRAKRRKEGMHDEW